MTNDLDKLAELLRLRNAADVGSVSEADFVRALPPLYVGQPDKEGVVLGFLVVPRTMPEEAWVWTEADTELCKDNFKVTYDLAGPPPTPTPAPAPIEEPSDPPPMTNPFTRLRRKLLR